MRLLPNHHLRRDTDDPTISATRLIYRQFNELCEDLGRARGIASVAQFPRVFARLFAYHASFVGSPLRGDAMTRAGAVVNGRRIKVVMRKSTSDLHVYREIFLHGSLGDLSTMGLSTARTIVDLGSNIGLASLYMACWAPRAKFYCAEPSEACNRIARANMHENSIDAIVDSVAIADSDGEVEFFANGWWASGTIVESIRDVRINNPERFENALSMPVQVAKSMKFATFLDQHDIQTIDLLKVDIEGAELQLFSGDASWLRRVRIVIIEIHDKYVAAKPVLDALGRNGFVQQNRPGALLTFVRDGGQLS